MQRTAVQTRPSWPILGGVICAMALKSISLRSIQFFVFRVLLLFFYRTHGVKRRECSGNMEFTVNLVDVLARRHFTRDFQSVYVLTLHYTTVRVRFNKPSACVNYDRCVFNSRLNKHDKYVGDGLITNSLVRLVDDLFATKLAALFTVQIRVVLRPHVCGASRVNADFASRRGVAVACDSRTIHRRTLCRKCRSSASDTNTILF